MDPTLLMNSLTVAGASTMLSLLLALPVSLWMEMAGRRTRFGLVGMSIVVLALPAFFVAGMWMEIVGFAGAWRVGGESAARWLPMAISGLVLGLMLWPVAALLLAGAWDRVDARLLEAYPGLRGASFVRHVLWPGSREVLLQAAAFMAALALGNFAVPSLFQARIWPEAVWVEFSTRFDAWSAWVQCWPLIPVSLALAAIGMRRPLSWPRIDSRGAAALVEERLGPVGAWGVRLASIAVLAAAAVFPIAWAGGAARTWTELPGAWAAAWPALVRSMFYAGVAATLVVGLGMWLARRRWPVVSAVPFFLPGIFTGIVLLRLFEHPPLLALREGPAIVLLGLGLRYAFVGWFVASRLLRSTDVRMREATRLAGGGWIAQWRHVVWPVGANGVVGAWLLVYVLALWDVETLVLIVPPGGDSLALMIFNLLHYGHNAQVSALCVLLAGAAVAPAIGAALLRRRWLGRGSAPACLLALLWPVLPGCSPAGNTTQANLESVLFDSVQVIGARGNGIGQFQKPRSLTVDHDDCLYVVDMTGRVQKFGPDGRCQLSWQMPETDQGKPKGMATAPDGTILVVEPHYHRVNRFAADGRLLAQWGVHGTNQGELWFPRAIAVEPNGDCFVSEYGRVERVQRFSADGAAFLGSFGVDGTGPSQLNRAEGLGIDPEGNVHVADSCNHRVQVFSSDGRLLRTLGRAGQGIGEFSYPYDVRIDSAGYRFVCEFGNSRVQVFDVKDQPVEILGGAGAAPGRMNNPWSLCLDSHGNLYVADSLNHRVLRFHRRTMLALW